MKNFNRILSLSLAVLMLCGCSSKNNSQNTSSDTNGNTMSEQKELPVLSIQTKSTDPDVTDFVFKPVAEHVAKSMEQWDPKYATTPAPYYEDCSVTLTSPDGSVMLSPCDAQVKVRGNWTTLYKKKPLRIKFTEKQNLLGLNDGQQYKNWLLLAEYKDGSMLRNKAALYASREILGEDGLFAADADLVQVELNGEYLGLYLLTEMLQAADGRVDINRPEKDYTGTDIGYFLEYDGYFKNEDEMHGFSLDLADNAPLTPFDGEGGRGRSFQCQKTSKSDPRNELGMTIKSDVYSQEQHDFIENFVNGTYRIMYEAAYNDKAFVFDKDFKELKETTDITPQQAVENVVNIDSLADMYIISELTCDADISWSSFYMDADFSAEGSKKLTFEAPWDFDSSMGNRDRCIDGQGFYAANIMPDPDKELDSANPWLMVLAYEDWYQDIIKEKWTKAYDNGAFERTCQMIENDSASLDEEFRKNYAKWNNIIINSEFVFELSEPAKECLSEETCAAFLVKWLHSRIDFLNSQWHT